MLLILCMYALFAAEFPLAKLALRETNAFFLETMRMMIGGTVLMSYYCMRHPRSEWVRREDWGLFTQLILFYMYFSYFAGGWALQYISSLKANMLYSLVPFVSATFAYLIFRDRPTLQKIIGMVMGVFGLILILIASEPQHGRLREYMHLSLPEIMMLVSIFSTEYGYFLLKRLFDKGYSLVLINGLAMFIGGALSLASAFLFFEEQVIQYSNFFFVFGYAALLFFIVNIVDIALYGTLVKQYSITFLTFAGFLSPLFGILYSVVLMGEAVSLIHLLACGFILCGLYLFARHDTVQQSIL